VHAGLGPPLDIRCGRGLAKLDSSLREVIAHHRRGEEALDSEHEVGAAIVQCLREEHPRDPQEATRTGVELPTV